MADTNSKTAAVLISQVSVPPISLRRRMVDHAMTGVAVLTVGLVLVPLFAIFAYLVYRGIGSINISFLTQTPNPVGEPRGGMANAIVGSGVLLWHAGLARGSPRAWPGGSLSWAPWEGERRGA